MNDYSEITHADFNRAVMRDTTNQQQLEYPEVPNTGTLNAFAEDKAAMPVFKTITELRKDLLA